MKKTLAVIAVLALLTGGVALWGLNRSGDSGQPRAETSQKLLLAEKFLERGEAGKAIEVFDELAGSSARIGEEGEAMYITALDQAGRHDDAIAAADQFLQRYPQSSHRKQAELVRLTSELKRSGLANPGLRQSVEDFLAKNPNHPGAVKLHYALAEQEIEVGDFSAAQRRLERIMRESRNDEMILRLAQPLGRANLEKLFSPAAGVADTTHTVERGDTINGIARKHGVTEELLMRCNNITDPRTLRIGQRLKVPNVDFSLHVDIAANTLVLKNFGEFFKMYPVRTGREAGTTPTGEFRILNKKRNPTWRPGNGDVYLPGDPNNELGTRWMAFEGDLLGIHGTLHDETVGEYASNGCIGMLKEEVEELFDLIVVGTALSITGEQDFTRHRLIPAPDIPPPQQVAARN